jgi:uncharacterized membrane protein HdeD (DUF308 family)
MIFTSLNLETKTLRIISLIATLTGIIFILLSNFIGNTAIRTAMVLMFILCVLNIKSKFSYSNTKEKLNYTLGAAAAVLIFFKPQLAMFAIGVIILFLTVPILYKAIRNRDFSDIVKFAVSAIGTIFAVYCILNSRAALNTAIIIIGISFVIIGCILFFDTFVIERKKKKYATYEKEEHRFEKVE